MHSDISALFTESDTMLFRPIETWVEDGRKRSRVGHKQIFYGKGAPNLLRTTISQLLGPAERDRFNLFFGVCPRIGDNGRFDLAWQIRTARALWTDVDHVTVDEPVDASAKTACPNRRSS